MLNSNTKRKINNARDILVGKIPMPTTQVEQITLALIYKFMADMDKRSKALGDTSGFFANGYEKYSWEKLMDKAIPARDRVKLYGEGLEKMSTNPHIPQLFRNIFRNAFLPFNDPEVLKLFLDQIDQFDYEHSEELGNAFEYLLSSMSSQGDAGQFRTPRHIIDFIVKVVDPKKTDRILDPACGTAGFLISAYKHLVTNGLKNDELKNVSKNFVGYDISHDMVRLSLVNLYLHHFPDPHIYEYDTLTSEDRWDDDFDVILANPPFMTPKGGMKTHSKFSIPSKKAEVLFTDYIMEHLSINGKAGVIVPEGIIFQSQNAYKDLRKMMIEDDYLWAVVSLPSGVFNPYSGVKTSILLFDKTLAKKTNKVLFVKVENDGYGLGAQRRQIKKDDLPGALEILQNYKQAITDGKELEIKDDNFAHLVEKVKIKESGDWNLSGERYWEKQTINSDYNLVTLDKVLNYEQPTKYLVQNTEYSEKYSTPVLTAGKSFLLGYTNEKTGIYEPVDYAILFDDFTTATKLVDFPFKVKSSALKILTVKKELADIRYLFYIIQAIKFDSSKHKRYWISQYSKLSVPLPPLSIQQEIVEELDRYQKIIDGARQVVDNYHPEFEIEKDWKNIALGELIVILTDYHANGSYKSLKENVTLKNEKDYAWLIRSTDFENNFENNFKYIDKKAYDFLSKSKVFTNDLIINKIGNAGRVYLVPELDSPCSLAMNQFLVRIDESRSSNQFIYYYLKQPLSKILINRYLKGATTKTIDKNSIRNLEIKLPPINIQKKIISQIKEEKEIIKANQVLIEKFEEKIKRKIKKIWKK
jgi:type I restriction enzyme M protein